MSISRDLSLALVATLGGVILFAGGCTDNVSPTRPTNAAADGDAGQSESGDEDGGGGTSTDADGGTNPQQDSGAAPQCVSSFGGDELVTGFGRIDGTLVGIARPQDRKCELSNATHVTLEISMHGQNYAMQVNVQSDSGSPDVYFAEKEMPLPGAAWSEGWHSDATLSYQDDLGAHSEDFTPYDNATLTSKVVSDLTIGKKISVYATEYAPNGGHDVHKQYGYTTDGAIVLDPDSASSKVLMFRFDDSPQF